MTGRMLRGPLLLFATLIVPTACASPMAYDAAGVPIDEECDTQL